MSPALVNLVEDHGFISGEYYLYWYELKKPKAKLRKLILKVDNIIPF